MYPAPDLNESHLLKTRTFLNPLSVLMEQLLQPVKFLVTMLLLQYYNRYRLPIMHTETNICEPNAVQWFYKEWANVHQLKMDGVPVVGFTWYSLTHQVDWDTALREDVGRANTLGLYDLDRNLTPVGRAYKKVIEQWRDVLVAESYGLNF